MRAEDFDAIFYSGGHGPMWDLVDNPDSIALIEAFYNSGKPVAAVCHAPAVLHRVIYQGAPIVKGKRVTGFANSEEEAVQLTHVVPFLVEDELKRLGGLFEKAPDWQSFAITDGRLITGKIPHPRQPAPRLCWSCLRRCRPVGGFSRGEWLRRKGHRLSRRSPSHWGGVSRDEQNGGAAWMRRDPKALDHHWAAADATTSPASMTSTGTTRCSNTRRSGERIRGRRNIRRPARRSRTPSASACAASSAAGDLWVTEFILTYDGRPSYSVSVMEFQDGKVGP